jgi:hypothetical protein
MMDAMEDLMFWLVFGTDSLVGTTMDYGNVVTVFPLFFFLGF